MFAKSLFCDILGIMKKDLMVDDNLTELAQIFDKNGFKLYIVGGFVRNALMGFCETDIDICSSAKVEDVERILNSTRFSCVLINSKLGTLHIFDNAKSVEYEHTTFRAEKYSAGGVHSPDDVTFVDDIRADASRRDFSVNALYYDILGREILDFYDGVDCIKKRVIKTVETPEIVFSRDGLRILRMARISSELNFAIDDKTFKTAKLLVGQLGDISQERFNREIVSMLFADNKYQTLNKSGLQCRGLEILGELGAWKFVLTDFFDTLNTTQKAQINRIKWKLLLISPPALRVPAFLCDMFSALEMFPDNESVNLVLGVKGIMLNKKEIVRQSLIAEAFSTVKNGSLTSQDQIRLFLQKFNAVIPELFGLLKIAQIGQNILRIYELMRYDNTPFCIHDLAINGSDILENFPEIPQQKIGTILASLLTLCATMPELNCPESLLNLVKEYSS